MSIQEPVDLSAFRPEYPAPPRLHWAWLASVQTVLTIWLMGSVFHSHGQIGPLQLGLTILTFIIGNGWLLVQILWFRSVNRESVAFWLYLFIILFYAATEVVNIVHPKHGALYNIITISGCAFYIYSSFVFRRELEKHYNEAEPIGLKLTGVMTFFFNSYYFQYYFRKIALLKDEAAAIPAPPTA